MILYGNADEISATIYGHFELDIDESDYNEYSTKDLKEWLLDSGTYVIDDIDCIIPDKITDIEL